MLEAIEAAIHRNQDSILRCTYIWTSFLCLFMVIWILVLPASALMDYSTFHREAALFVISQPTNIVPEEIITKYQKHAAIHFTHILPAALWSLAIPFQFHNQFRARYPKLHRLSGYTFMISSILMIIGIAIIISRGLLFENFFRDIANPHSSSEPKIWGLSLWFFITVAVAFQKARKRQFKAHRTWMIRHVASGLWIAVQRVLLGTLGQVGYRPADRAAQRDIFGNAALVGVVVSFTMGEIALYTLSVAPPAKKHA